MEGIEFFLCTYLCRVAHPLLLVYTFCQSHLQVFHQLLHACFVFGREVLFDVEFAHSFAQDSVDGVDRALPTWMDFLTSRHYASVEIERLCIYFIAKCAGSARKQAPLHPVFQCLLAGFVEYCYCFLHCFGLTHREGVEVGDEL